MSRLLTILMTLALPAVVFASSGGEQDMSKLLKEFGFRSLVFVILVFVLFKLLKKPIVELLDKRGKDIQQAIKDAETAKENAKTELTKYEMEMKDMESKLAAMKEQSLKAIESEKSAILEDAGKQVEKLQKFAEGLIESDTRKAIQDIKREAVVAAIEAVEEKLGKESSPEKQKELLNKYISKVGV